MFPFSADEELLIPSAPIVTLVDRLMAILSAALDVSCAENLGILLPELPHAVEPFHRTR